MVILPWKLRLQNTPPCVVLARCLLYVRTTAAVLLYHCINMAIGGVDGLVGGIWVRVYGCSESVARLAAVVRARAKSSG